MISLSKLLFCESLLNLNPLAENIEAVIDTVHNAGISLKVARMVPIGVAKG